MLVEDVEKLEPLGPTGVNAQWCVCYGKQYGGSSKNEKSPYNSPILAPDIYPKELKTES